MNVPVLIINLDRSKGRWAAMTARASAAGITAERIPAVDGNAIVPAQRRELHARKFQILHGRRPLGAEYGCYTSHLRALERVLQAGWPYAVILEDDAAFGRDFSQRIAALIRLDPPPELVKLYNHRTKGFIARTVTDSGDAVGRCMHGPLGSAAGYLVSREGARKLREGIVPMFLPYDIALERGWAHGVDVNVTQEPLIHAVASLSTIGGYKATKFLFYMRIPAALFRAQDYVRRFCYARWAARYRGRASKRLSSSDE